MPQMATRKPAAKKKPASRKPVLKRAKPRAQTSAQQSSRAQRPAQQTVAHDVLKGLPILWAHRGEGQAVGLHLDDNEVWAGWESGDVVACSHDGEVLRRWKLPAGVDALVADEVWRYAGCRDGNIYDLTGRTPRVAYEVNKNAHVQWIDIYRGNLCASDSKGACTAVDIEQNPLFKYAPKGCTSGWMVRADGSGVYLGNSKGVTKLDWQGQKIWTRSTGPIGYGWPEGDNVYVLANFAIHGTNVTALRKDDGKVVAVGKCESKEKHYNFAANAASCAAKTGGDIMFGGTRETIWAFDTKGNVVWETGTGVGSTCSMAYKDGRLYVVTHTGTFACLDVSDDAIARAKTKAQKSAKVRKLEKIAVTAREMEETKSVTAGVVVECIKDGGKLRVRVVSPGYRNDWHCQFPRDIREEGAKYVVDEVREAAQGGFYRVLGEIRRLRS
jgi:hypothetical protein